MTIKYVVPDDAPIITACEQADVPLVQSLLKNRKASLNDITERGRTPIMVILSSYFGTRNRKTGTDKSQFAVESRDYAMVKLLID